jgi:hypothetical protein
MKKETEHLLSTEANKERLLEDVFNDEKRQGVKDLIDAHKQTDENGKPITYWGGLAEPKQENCCTPVGQIKSYIDFIGCDCKPKQETEEEPDYEKIKQSLIEFRKTPMTFVPDEKMYSKQDLEKAFKVGYTIAYDGDVRIDEKDEWFNRWFKIFKDNQNEKK